MTRHPNPFTFTDQTGVALSTVITSNPITVSGISVAVHISITGGTYAINSGAYTSAGGTVNKGDTVTVRQTSSASYSTTTDATLTIGGVSDTFSVTTVVNLWTQRADFGETGRYAAVGFSIGGKGYIGTGYDAMGDTKDFWEYDPVANTWTQRADFMGRARHSAVGFAIGGKGYIGTERGMMVYIRKTFGSTILWPTPGHRRPISGGRHDGMPSLLHREQGLHRTGEYYDGSSYHNVKDFWEYDPVANTWTQKADFGGTTRQRAVGFSIGGKGYIGLGSPRAQKYKRLLGVRSCGQYLDTQGRFRGDIAIWRCWFLQREQGLHRDGTRYRFII